MNAIQCCAGFLHFDEGLSRKDYMKRKCTELIYGWHCPPGWHTFAHLIELFIMDAFVDLFITMCIVINTAFMALDHAGMSDELANILIVGNYVRHTAAFSRHFYADQRSKVLYSC